ncbi:MAG TPA: SNF2-related protein [Bryobacteraceae bacterium]|nr:SNF2-related protein [Bryobacteraceae bacterium]
MKLSSFLQADFNIGSRSRGVEYYQSGAVKILKGGQLSVEAKVRGQSGTYETEIEVEPDGELFIWCDCPYFESNNSCKHLWATLLAAESRGLLGGVLDAMHVATEFDLFGDPVLSSAMPQLIPKVTAPPRPPAWVKQLNEVAAQSKTTAVEWPRERQILYVVDVPNSAMTGTLVLKLMTREPKKAGGWKKPATPRLSFQQLAALPDPADRHILGMLTGASAHSWMYPGSHSEISSEFRLRHPLSATLVPEMTGSGRFMLQLDITGTELLPLAWDAAGPWTFHLRLDKEELGNWAIMGSLRRGSEEMDLKTPLLITDGGLVFTRERVAPLADGAPFEWIAYLRKSGPIAAGRNEADALLAALLEHPLGGPLEVPEELRFEQVRVPMRPSLTIRTPQRRESWNPHRLRAQLSFDYQGRRITEASPARGVYDPAARTFLVRDLEAESAARDLLRKLGATGPATYFGKPEPQWELASKKLPVLVRECVQAGWHIDAEGKVFRRPGAMRMEVSSGIDWFELHGEVEYGEAKAKLPQLLAALRRGETMVQLDDGTYGLLPDEWLARFGAVAGLGQAEGGHLRFQRSQAGLLDALLAAQPEARCDETFARVRDQIRRFEGIRAAEQPVGFAGQLRDYQKEGVGWMEFLRTFGFGGCLADDMGVGKTAQVLALLESRRILREKPRSGEMAVNGNGDAAPAAPSLVVVPKSLVFNWKQEAARFTPRLRVLDHTGGGRSVEAFSTCDIVLTTYGTLRRDALEFKDIEFDYIVLDEAQAIKNADTESAKAVRLLRGRHRLALSGTPVENHLGELWSLFEFLNPGMLGSASVFKLAGAAGRNPTEETRKLLGHALRPFILRRTKEQVARELPAKSEQTIYCELEGPQRKLYNELRDHYRNSLLHAVERQGLAKSQMQVLEALLRLRQAACHTGLLDSKRLNDPSAKLDLLMTQLEEVIDEGHKALVFSQFTSLLSIVRQRLKDSGIAYEYLDGATRDREQRVTRFQTDPACPVFLISLKAGGLGLNLTAAEYVFLLDPWWNPAVEAQAVDRAHRIGQSRQVFAYRLIARDTVEEKVLQLQSTKRDLAAAIISEDNSPLRNLKREDLELLLS